MNHYPELQSRQQAYLLLEKSSVVDLRQVLYQQEAAPEWTPLFLETPWAPYLEESPLVIGVHPESGFFQWAVSAMTGPEQVRGLVIESPANLAVVAEWARQRLTVRFDEGRTALLRFYDPRVWAALRPDATGDPGILSRVLYWPGQAGGEGWQSSDNPEFVMPGHPASLDRARADALLGVHG